MSNTEVTKIPCPCIECICVPVCTSKRFVQLFQDCLYLRIYESRYTDPRHRVKEYMLEIEKYLKPSEWGVKYNEKAKMHMIYSKTYGVWIDYPIDDNLGTMTTIKMYMDDDIEGL